MKRLGRKRWAFTLVEILIVLLLIGILAGALMLVSFSVTAKAKATRIVEDMRSLKAAAMLYYADYGTWPLWMYSGGHYLNADPGNGHDALPEKYVESNPVMADYWVGVASRSGQVAVFAVFRDPSLSPLDSLAKERLEAMIPEIPLCWASMAMEFKTDPYTSDKDIALWYIKKP
jgi:prepilin-type N-terminal cleavage/methylation domain